MLKLAGEKPEHSQSKNQFFILMNLLEGKVFLVFSSPFEILGLEKQSFLIVSK